MGMCCSDHGHERTVEMEMECSVPNGSGRSKSSQLPSRIDQVYEMQLGRDAILGHSSIGFVVKADHKHSRTLRAVKQICKRSIEEGSSWKGEIEAISSLDHPHICNLHEYWEDPIHVYLIMELCKGGDLTNLSANKSHINESTMAALVWQMASAVSALHQNKVYHGDVRLENWLFGESVNPNSPRSFMSLKMIDFGIAQKYGRPTARRRSTDQEAREVLSGMRGGPKKMAPNFTPVVEEEDPRRRLTTEQTLFCKSPEQLAERGETNDKVDVWALGVIAYFLLSGQPPFQSALHSTDAALFRSATFVFMPAELWRPISSEAKHFIAMCLQKYPEKRPEASQVLSLPWMSLGSQAAGDLTNGTGTRRACARPGDLANSEVTDPNLPSAGKLAKSLGRMGRLHVLEKATIAAAAHQLTTPAIEEFKAAVQSRDKEHEGSVSITALFEELEHAGVQCHELAKLIQDIDTAGITTVIDYYVFCNDVVEFQQNLQDSAAWAVFRSFETNPCNSEVKVKKKDINKTILGEEGIRQGITESYPQRDLDLLLQDMDHDETGVIDFEEFKGILSGNALALKAPDPILSH